MSALFNSRLLLSTRWAVLLGVLPSLLFSPFGGLFLLCHGHDEQGLHAHILATDSEEPTYAARFHSAPDDPTHDDGYAEEKGFISDERDVAVQLPDCVSVDLHKRPSLEDTLSASAVEPIGLPGIHQTASSTAFRWRHSILASVNDPDNDAFALLLRANHAILI